MIVPPDEAFAEERRALRREIELEARDTRSFTGRDSFAPAVMEAIERVPRHLFVPGGLRERAYLNRPLPIGGGQTISQPYIVALMSDLVEIAPGQSLLEIGTGCGYQAAVLAEMGARVFSIERLPELGRLAERNLAAADYHGVHLRVGNGARGWPEEAPFDAVLITAAAWQQPPQALVDQLAAGGRMVLPVERGRSGAAALRFWDHDQTLCVLAKDEEGQVHTRDVLPVAFVPLVDEEVGTGGTGAGGG